MSRPEQKPASASPGLPFLFGIDTGGTFTDFVAMTPDGRVYTHKQLSTPADPAVAVLDGLDHLLQSIVELSENEICDENTRLVHGSTVATNAILERTGARTALVTTEGFGDLLAIGRQNRRQLYDLTPTAPVPLVDREDIVELPERMSVDGRVLHALDMEAARRLARRLKEAGIESVALVFLHSYVNPEHEQAVAQRLRQAGLMVSASFEVLPEHREYERASTTALNAYVAPLMSRYLNHLSHALHERGFTQFRVMQSSGGVTSPEHAGTFAVHTVLSGPAGGVVGALHAGEVCDVTHLITLDMGGTSTDVALIPGTLQTTTESDIEGFPVRIPVLDIHTVGSGGGSIAWIDAGGALRVGPRSAGADPGPAAYGRGGKAFTVTDANLLLGRLPADWFLGGALPLDPDAAKAAAGPIAEQMGATWESVAFGTLQVVNANMERAVKVISVERGHDPREFTLVCFGGAGALHGCELARNLRIPRVLVPPYPGILSALGMARARVVKSYVQALLAPVDANSLKRAQDLLKTLHQRARTDLELEGVAPDLHTYIAHVDVRYVHQSYELSIPAASLMERSAEEAALKLSELFNDAHESAYGHAHPGEPIELVAVRLRAEGILPTPPLPAAPSGQRKAMPVAERGVYFTSGWKQTPIYERAHLGASCTFEGPAVVVEKHATTLIPPDAVCTVRSSGALMITLG